MTQGCKAAMALRERWATGCCEGLPRWLSGKESACQCRRWVRSLGQEDPLGEKMPTNSSITAWKIPWTVEPGGPQSTGSQRVSGTRLSD